MKFSTADGSLSPPPDGSLSPPPVFAECMEDDIDGAMGGLLQGDGEDEYPSTANTIMPMAGQLIHMIKNGLIDHL